MGGSVAFPFKQIVPYFRYAATPFIKRLFFRKVKVDTPPHYRSKSDRIFPWFQDFKNVRMIGEIRMHRTSLNV